MQMNVRMLRTWLLVALCGGVLVGCGVDETPDDGDNPCETDQVQAIGVDNEVGCFNKCVTALDCSPGSRCVEVPDKAYKLCQPQTSTNSMMNNSMTENNSNTSTNNNTSTMNNNTSTMNNNTSTMNNMPQGYQAPAAFDGLCVGLRDDGPDDTIDQAFARDYDADDRVIEYRLDEEGDGAINSGYKASYDEDGNLTYLELDEDGDGQPENIRRISWDSEGRQTSFTFDQDGDGTDDYSESSSYDSEGRQTYFARDGLIDPMTSMVTQAADGNLDYIAENAWHDPSGEQTLLRRDINGDGTPDLVVTWTRDSEGRLLKFERDGNVVNGMITPLADGRVDFVDEWTRSLNGEPTRRRIDADGDMSWDTEQAWVYDAATDKVSTITYDGFYSFAESRVLQAADGQIDRRDSFDWDPQTRIQTQRIDGGANGTIEAIIRRGLDARDNPTRVEYDYDNNGSDDLVEVYSYDVNGELLSYEQDGFHSFAQGAMLIAPDGTMDFTFSQTFDSMGNRTAREIDGRLAPNGSFMLTADGTPDYTETAVYDDQGRQISYEQDGQVEPDTDYTITEVADGQADFKLVRNYDAQDRVIYYEIWGARDGDGVVTTKAGMMASYIIRRTYNDNGDLASRERDGVIDAQGAVTTPANGTFETTNYSYSPEGLLTKSEVDVQSDGTADYIVTTTYNAQGQRTGSEIDGVIDVDANMLTSPADGTIDTIITYSTDCY